MIKFFENRRKQKFLNRLKYGQDKKPVHTIEAMVNALIDGDEKKAKEIVHKLVEQNAKKELKAIRRIKC